MRTLPEPATNTEAVRSRGLGLLWVVRSRIHPVTGTRSLGAGDQASGARVQIIGIVVAVVVLIVTPAVATAKGGGGGRGGGHSGHQGHSGPHATGGEGGTHGRHQGAPRSGGAEHGTGDGQSHNRSGEAKAPSRPRGEAATRAMPKSNQVTKSPTNSARCDSCPRDSRGRIERSEVAKRDFMKQTGFPNGRPGYVVDHIVPLAKGGKDVPSNMQWQTIAAAKAKDKIERK